MKSSYKVVMLFKGVFAFIWCETLQLAEAVQTYLQHLAAFSQVTFWISTFSFGV